LKLINEQKTYLDGVKIHVLVTIFSIYYRFLQFIILILSFMYISSVLQSFTIYLRLTAISLLVLLYYLIIYTIKSL